MRNALFFTTLFLSLTLNSCHAQRTYEGSSDFVTKKLNLTDFTGVLVSDGTEATITYGTDFSVEIRVNDNLLDRVRSEVRNGVLFVAFESGSYRREKLSLDITMPVVSSLRAVDGAMIEAGNFPELRTLKLEAFDSGKIAISGAAKEVELRAADAGKIRAFDLSTGDCEARVSDGAKVEVRVQGRLTGRVSDGGNILYRGSPSVSVSTSDGGRVRAAN